jgi:peptidylprolyl isomerase
MSQTRRARQGDTVVVRYTARWKDGTVFFATEERQSLRFTIGSGEVLPAFEEVVVGMVPEESRTVKVEAGQAFGPWRQELEWNVPLSQVEGSEPGEVDGAYHPRVGDRVGVRVSPDTITPATVRRVWSDRVVLDANHPLAGQDVVFSIQLVKVETAEEATETTDRIRREGVA